jgi:Fe(3+) dicitrate transport protein
MVQRVHTEKQYSMADGVLVDNGDPESTTLDSDAVALAAAFHLHDDIEVGRVHLFPGLRVEMIEGWRTDNDGSPDDGAKLFRATPLPGLGGLIALSDNIDLFGGIHRGFSPVAPGQPADTEPETTWNSEAGVSYESYLGQIESVAYYNDYQNISGQCSFSSGCEGSDIDGQFNGGEAVVFGAEVSASTDLFFGTKSSVPISVSYTWTESHFTSSFSSEFPQFGEVEFGDSLPYQPTHSAKAQVGFRYDEFAFYADCTYRSAMLDRAGAMVDAPDDVPSLLLLGAAANLPIRDEMSLFATVSNITDERGITSWRPFGARPTAPMQIMIGLRLE